MDGTSENQPGKCGPLVRNASIAQARGCLQSLCSLGLHTFFRSALQIFLLAWDNSVTDVCFAGKKHTHTHTRTHAHEGDLDSTCSKVIAQDFAHCQSKWWRIAFVHVWADVIWMYDWCMYDIVWCEVRDILIYGSRSKGPCRDCQLQRPPVLQLQHKTSQKFFWVRQNNEVTVYLAKEMANIYFDEVA